MNSSPVLLSTALFKKKFSSLLSLDKHMTLSEIYHILKENNFDISSTRHKITKNVRKTQNPEVCRKSTHNVMRYEGSIGGSLACEDSDDETVEENCRVTEERVRYEGYIGGGLACEDSDEDVEKSCGRRRGERTRGRKRGWKEAFDSKKKGERAFVGRKALSSRYTVVKTISDDSSSTPWIQKIASSLFGKVLRPIGLKGEDIDGIEAVERYIEGLERRRWGAKCFIEEAMRMESEGKYKAGDCVIVRKWNPTESYSCSTKESSRVKYARIEYLFTKYDTPMAHIRRFKHGERIEVLGELASPIELFLLSACKDIVVSDILATIQVDYIGNINSKKSSDSPIDEECIQTGHYFYRLHYNPSGNVFTNASEYQAASRGRYCVVCEQQYVEEQKRESEVFSETDGSISGYRFDRRDYHLNDFVYFELKENAKERVPSGIGQIKSFGSSKLDFEGSPTIEIQVYERFDRFHPSWSDEIEVGVSHAVRDERKLYYSGKLVSLSAEELDGKCFVRHLDHIEDLDSYKDLDDTFWVAEQIRPSRRNENRVKIKDIEPMPAKNLVYSKESEEELRVLRESMEDLRIKGPKLRTLDIFSGAGGLSTGFHESGVIGATYAIEFDTAACQTIRINNPDAIVYNQDVNILLTWAIAQHADLEVVDIDLRGNTMKRMPRKGEIDMIIGGPPCKGWSNLNRHKKSDCKNNMLIAAYISFVELYRPKYFLLENVGGLLHTPLDNGKLKNGAKKFIFRALTSLGYQCKMALLQAGEYGCPQSRKRVIFWASLPGYNLPKYPQPTHIFGLKKIKAYHRERRSAAHFPISIGSCLTDLPNFEWENSHHVLKKTFKEQGDRSRRAKSIVQYSTIDKKKLVGLMEQPYASPPLSEYQRQIRRGNTNGILNGHVTAKPTNKYCEEVCNIPLKPDSSHLNLPAELISNLKNTGEDRTRGKLGRLGIEDTFKVAIANMRSPWNLHPYLHRTLSIREYSRVQGFPDNFIWDTDSMSATEIYRQIGNAVPVPFAKALGKELLKVLMDKWAAEKEAENALEMGINAVHTAGKQLDMGGVQITIVQGGSRQQQTDSNTIVIEDSESESD